MMPIRWKPGDPDPAKDDILGRIQKACYEEEAKLKAEAAKAKAREQAKTEKVVEFPSQLTTIQLQAIIDQHWQAMLDRKAELEDITSQSCHRGPSDPDWSA
jgi:hypothetical protein